jgi:hypothetical protein
VILEQRAKALLEALYDRYGGRDFYPTFTATWVEKQGGRKYFRVTGKYTSAGDGGRDYDRTHSRDEILQLETAGYIGLEARGEGAFDLSITDNGTDWVDSNFRRA